MKADNNDALLLSRLLDVTQADEALDMIQDAWIHRLEVEEKKIFWNDLYDLDVKGRSLSLPPPPKKDVEPMVKDMETIEVRLLKVVNEKFEELKKQVKKLKRRVKVLEDVKRIEKDEESEEDDNEKDEESEEDEEEEEEVVLEKKKQEVANTPRPRRTCVATFVKGSEFTAEGKNKRKRIPEEKVGKANDAKKPKKTEKKPKKTEKKPTKKPRSNIK